MRRVAITLTYYGIPFTQTDVIPLGTENKARLAESGNPLTRVPILEVTTEGSEKEVLIDSHGICDALEGLRSCGSSGKAALFPAEHGRERREVVAATCVAVGVAEKAVAGMLEWRIRQESQYSQEVADMVARQVKGGLEWLEERWKGPYLRGNAMSGADVAALVAYNYVRIANPDLFMDLDTPSLQAAATVAESTPLFANNAPDAEYDIPQWAYSNPI